MPRLIAPAEAAPAIDFAGFIDAVGRSGFDPACEESFAAMGPLLARLGADRTFLGDRLVAMLKDGGRTQDDANPYGPQVVLLHRGDGWFVRANIWPATQDAALRASGPRAFFYGVPHDHNFSFLTVGYFGPGYWSDYWEADYPHLAGHPGEPAGLRFVGRSRLAEGRLLLYRAHRDVHAQHPPDSLSVSLNLMQAAPGQSWRDQYRYDPAGDAISGIIGHHALTGLIALLPALGGEAGRGLLADFAARHPSDRIRFGAIDALAAAGSIDTRTAVYEAATAAPNRFVAGMARHRLAEIARGAAWRQRGGRGGSP